MYYKYVKSDDKIDLMSEKKYLSEVLEKEGVLYRKKTEPVVVAPAKKDMIVLESGDEKFFSTGDLVFKKVKAGTLLVNESYPVTKEQLLEQYEPFRDEFGDIVKGVFTKINESLVVRNPFGKTVIKVNQRGYVYEEGDSDCFLTTDNSTGDMEFVILTEKQLNDRYVKVDLPVLKKDFK